jgi:hypothetical protein
VILDDAGKLRILAAWLDLEERQGLPDPSDEVQQDLRRIADHLDSWEQVRRRYIQIWKALDIAFEAESLDSCREELRAAIEGKDSA